MKAKSLLAIVTFLSLLILAGCYAPVVIAPTTKPTQLSVKIAYYKGTLFTADHTILKLSAPGYNPTKRFTPNDKEIENANHVLTSQVATKNRIIVSRQQYFALGKYERLLNLNAYFNQYVGYLTPEGDKILHMNLLWNKDKRFKPENDYVIVPPGDTRYWQAEVNLVTQKVIAVRINPEM